jgi:MurNAc alpha-1-phosphate uridylyltransferase
MNKHDKIEQAFILAAGYAKRMRPLTDHLPKPLVLLGGRPILSHIIDELVDVGVQRIVINGHHCVEKLHDYMPVIRKQYPSIDFILSVEDEILETGGGTVMALNHLDNNKPFYMINGDAYWVSSHDENTLTALQDQWNTSDTDMVLLLQSTDKMAFGKRVGDYDIDAKGKAVRSMNQAGTHMFMGLRILHPRIMKGYKPTSFSFLKIMDETENNGK